MIIRIMLQACINLRMPSCTHQYTVNLFGMWCGVLHRQVSRQRDARTKRESATLDRVAAAQQKEDDTRAAFMAQMGLQAGQKITIKPRES
jgi:hypothetical protein